MQHLLRAPVLLELMRLLGRAALAWGRHGGSSMGAAIAFYALISLPPAIATTLVMTGLVLNPGAAREALLSQIQMLWGPDAAATAMAIARYVARSHAQGWIAWGAFIAGVVTASTVFVEMRRSLDIIWGAGHAGAVAGILKSRLTAFAVLVLLGLAIWVSVLASALLEVADTRYFEHTGISAMTFGMIGNAIAGTLILILLTLLYKLLPACHVAWREAWGGASVVTCLYLVGKGGIAYYLGRQTIAPAYGSGIAGAIIVLLLWFYYSAQIFLYGAELAHEMSLKRDVRPGDEGSN